MELFNSKTPIELFLNRNLERSIKAGHPWVYADSIEAGQSPKGNLAILKAKNGKTIAKGIYDRESPLAFRVCVVGNDPLDDHWVKGNLEKAFSRRSHILNVHTNACRLIFGEGDNLPGLVCDIYGDVLVFQLDGAGPAGFWNVKNITLWFSQKMPVKTAYLKYRSDQKKAGEILLGDKALSKVLFQENGVKFKADIINGQKTGFFLDQRENRLRIKSLSNNKTVLNLFGYTGGFAVYAGVGKARHVTSVDISKSATMESHQNWLLNDLRDDLHLPVTANAFDFLAQACQEKKKWDMVVADPPSFASSSKNVEKAKHSYINLFASAAKVLNKRGILAASSCSSHINSQLFHQLCEEAISKANRRGTVLGFFNQPEDHPYPLACQELRYLKFLLIMVD